MTPQEFINAIAKEIREKRKPVKTKITCKICLSPMTSHEVVFSDKCPSCLLIEKMRKK